MKIVRQTPSRSQRRADVMTRLRRQANAADALERTAKGNVLHQRNVWESAHPLENFAPNKQRLIAGADLGHARAIIDQRSDDFEHPVRAFQLDIETAAEIARVAERRRDIVQRRLGQPGIGVQK